MVHLGQNKSRGALVSNKSFRYNQLSWGNSFKSFLARNQLGIGYLELTIAQCFVGINVISGKFLIGYFPIFLLLAIRFTIGFVGMLGIAFLKQLPIIDIYRNFMSLSSKDKLLLIFQAACGGFLFNILILYGMKTTSATSAGIISSITPIMILVLSTVFLREKINLQKGFAILIVMLGLIILNMGKNSSALEGALLGNFLVLLAVIPEALFTILSKSVGKKITEIEAVILVNFFNLIMFIPFTFISISSVQIAKLSFSIGNLLFIYGISGGMMFFLLWYRGLTKVSANIAALFTGVMPISTTILAFLFLKESISVNDIVGMCLVISAIFIGCYKNSS
jgi:drug/metabolite transporter (DMT)-like permease